MEASTSPHEKKWKLKDPKVLRIFFSSPFNGMEGEREELTRKYFPQFHHACNSHGMRFVAVDMRWGITTEAADNAQVIRICLRELDRSDVFVGFFGQRYGWHGESDELLQKNFDNAAMYYPWLNDLRDRSVTEIEYLHGHLNHPGELPACICFRDEAFDDALRQKAVEDGNKRNIYKYSSESEHASQMMNNLIERVSATESQLLGVDIQYKNPIEGAKFIFESVWETCLQLIADANATEESPLMQDRVCHDALISSLTSLYIDGDNSLDKLNRDNFQCGAYALKSSSHHPTAAAVNGFLVHGVQGSGKSSLLANVVKKLQAEDSKYQIVYHFIGSGPGTTSPENILHRTVAELENIGHETKPDDPNDNNAKDSSNIGQTSNDKDIQTLFVKMQSEMERVVSLGFDLVLIFDGLDKVKSSSKTAKHLFWLPGELPKGVTMIASTATSDKDTLDLLVTEQAFVEIEIQSLSPTTKAFICKELLMKSGKELSPHQLQKIVDAEQTKNPRFLNIVLSEISIFGYFRLLDNKIDTLVNCQGIEDLLCEVLQRMEKDYDVKDHPVPLVKQVLSAIAVSYQGLSETEIQDMFEISSYIWSPFFFALEKFLISHGGLLRFSFHEMKKAVEDRYFTSEEERFSAMRNLVKYFDKVLKTSTSYTDLDNVINERVASELPWIQKSLGDPKALAETISDPRIFYQLQKKSTPELLDLWKDTILSANNFLSIFFEKFDLAIEEIYSSQTDHSEQSQEPPGFILETVLTAAKKFFDYISQHGACIQIIKRAIKILEGIEGKIDERVRQIHLRDSIYFLATTYVDDGQYDMAMPLFQNIQLDCEEILKSSEDASIKQTLGYVCNGLGVLHIKKFQFDEAEPLFHKSAEIHLTIGNDELAADSQTNIGVIKMNSGQLQEALDYFSTALQTYERIYFGHLPLIVGNLLTNIALCYRRMNNLDLAEEMYNRSLKVKLNAVGPLHEVVAMAYVNLGVVEMCRNNSQMMLEYTRKAADIFEALEMKLEQDEVWQCYDNLVLAFCREKKHEEALPIFIKVFSMLRQENKVHRGHTGCYLEMMQHMLSHGMFKEVADFVEVYVDSPELRQPSCFKILHHCDMQLPPDERPVRDIEQTISYALKEIWPGNNELTAYYINCEVLPANDIDQLIELLNIMDTMNPDFMHTTYEVGAIWCDNARNHEALLKVAEAGLLKYPEVHSLKTRLFDALRQLRRYEEAYEIMHGILEKEKDNQPLMLVCGQVAVMANDVALCRELWGKVATMEDENLALKAKGALQTLEDSLKEENKDREENKSE